VENNPDWIFVRPGNRRSRLKLTTREHHETRANRHVLPSAWYSASQLKERNIAFRNLGGLEFTNVAPAWGLDELGISFGSALCDLNADGYQDLIINNFGIAPSVYGNRGSTRHRLKIRLLGVDSNRYGIGATLHIEAGGQHQVRYLSPDSGYMSSDEPLVYFGLGEADSVGRLTVEWPSGHRQEFRNLPADYHYTITEPSWSDNSERSQRQAGPSTESSLPLFTRLENFPDIRHHEQFFDDYQRQPLLPHKLSQLGPGLACSDIDGDGNADVFLGGAAGEVGHLLLQRSPGLFLPSAVVALESDAASEDMGILFFDADLDDDEDLYIVSGGVECQPGAPVIQDRLYLNQGVRPDGTVHFVKAEGRLPDLRDSGGVVTATDFDHDGDLDLFVGGRVVPSDYPSVPHSRLLQNDEGKFLDVTANLAPGLLRTGMVVGALWSDANADGWVDLLLTLEYGAPRFFRNNRGLLEDKTATAGLASLSGWWNGIAGCDVDHDGDIDYALSNLGINNRYRPTAKQPHVLFYGKFDDRSLKSIAEGRTTPEGLQPFRGRLATLKALPSLIEKAPSFDAYAAAQLSDLFGEQRLDQAFRLEVNTAESGILINDGRGGFTFRPLHRLAQIAPGFGLVFLNANGDAHPDLFIAQNFFSPNREVGRLNGGVSLLLAGRGDGSFEPIWPNRSGLLIPGDAKSAVAVDLNSDGWQDLLVAANDDALHAFVHQGQPPARTLRVTLKGRLGNRSAVGARIRLTRQSGLSQDSEVYSGQGYLSQYSTELTFPVTADDPPTDVQIFWPLGQRTRRAVTGAEIQIVEREPETHFLRHQPLEPISKPID